MWSYETPAVGRAPITLWRAEYNKCARQDCSRRAALKTYHNPSR
jgi:hypothetical protein